MLWKMWVLMLWDFIYSRASNKFDNVPKQRTVGSFKEFANVVLSDTSKQKGETYVCADVKEGLHTDQEKYPGKNHWRQQGLALPRRFLAFDFDGFITQLEMEILRKPPLDSVPHLIALQKLLAIQLVITI